MTTAEIQPVAKSKGRPKQSARADTTVKIDRTLVGRAKTIATYRGVSVAELLSEALRAPLTKMWGDMIRDVDKGAK